jgi:hypothetical protein
VSYRCFLAAVLVVGLPAWCQAQYNNRGQAGRQPMGMPVEIRGTIQGVARGMIVVVDSNNQTWRIAILPATKVLVTGTATAASLRPGLVLELTAEIDNRGVIQGKVGQLTVTSITPQKQPGIFPAETAKGGDDKGDFGAPKGDDSSAAGGKADKRAPRAHGKAAAGATVAGTYRVVGRLVVGRGGALAIQTGRGALAFELGEEPAIKVEMADLSAVKQGNEVSVMGMAMPNRPGLAQAHQVKVTLPEPAGVKKEPAGGKKEAAGDGKEPGAKPKEKRPPKGPKKGDDAGGLPEPAPEK